jgi:lysine-N-methylase
MRSPTCVWAAAIVLNHAPGGGCVFLMEDGRCRIHAKYGYEAKPLGCQLYPFTLESDGELIRAGIRFDCPSVSGNQGEALGKHRRDVGRIASALKQELPDEYTAATFPLMLAPGRRASQAEADMLIDSLDAWLRDANRPLCERLLAVCDFVSVLGRAKLDSLDEPQCIDLITMLAKDMPKAVEEMQAGVLEPPTPRELKLLRQSIFSHCESITIEQARRTFFQRLRYRFGQLRRASAFTSGTTIPPLIRGVKPLSFEDVERVKPASGVSADCEALMMRYLRASILTRQAFGKAYYGWSILDGLNALLLACPTIGWLTRYVAAATGRDAFELPDLKRGLGVVDRAAGRMPELGSHPARLRTRYLADDRGIDRLIKAYPLCE